MWAVLDDALGRSCARWVAFVRARPRSVLVSCLALTLAAAIYTALNLGLNSDENDLFSEELAFAPLRSDFYRAFPSLVDPIVVVIDADTRDLAEQATQRLGALLADDQRHFHSVFEPGGGPFFERHGLLYWTVDELEELSDNLAAAQPYLARLSRDPSLRGLSTLLADSVQAVADGDFPEADLEEVLRRVGDGVVAVGTGRPYSLAWGDLILGQESSPGDRRRFLLLEPAVDSGRVNPAESALLALREAIRELGLDAPDAAVRARVTGLYALAYEEMEQVGRQTGLAGLAAVAIVAAVLGFGVGSLRMVLASLVALGVGLVWTAGFAALAIGHLNLISVSFAVLFIGLSIDFAIHLCIRQREHRLAGLAEDPAWSLAARRMGAALFLCAATTAIAFFSFVPTDYAGVAELGLIAGAGMLVSLALNLTLLPALLALWPSPPPGPAPPPSRALQRLRALPLRHARAVAIAALALALVAAALCTRLEFDPNPLRMRDPSAQSVQAFYEMLESGDAFPWNVNVLAGDRGLAMEVAQRLESLEQVDYTVTLGDFLPERQPEKLAVLADAELLLGPALELEPESFAPSPMQRAAGLGELRAALARLPQERVSPALALQAERLRRALDHFLGGAREADLLRLEQSLLGALPERLRRLRAALRAETVELADLPGDLVERMVARDGRVRVEVYPRGDLSDNRDLESYVAAVQRIAPDAFGEGLVILESGRAVVTALREALLGAGFAILLLLLLLWRRLSAALLVAVPLGLAALFTGAAAVLLGIPLNFANVIVIPLLLGMGVDSAIHLIYRFAEAPAAGTDLLGTGTARAVLVSALTTIGSFGTLGLSSHLGMASLGRLLTLGIAMTLLANLVILPALLQLAGPRGAERARAYDPGHD